MAEVLVQFTEPLQGPTGRSYLPRACGRERADGTWEGWIEFVPQDGGDVLPSRRETTQPNRDDLLYWATGLTPTFLEGVLQRTLVPAQRVNRVIDVEPAYEAPAPESEPRTEIVRPAAQPPHPILDPFDVYRQGEDVLRKTLLALDAPRLVDIITAHQLHEGKPSDLYRAALAELIVAGVRRRLGAAS